MWGPPGAWPPGVWCLFLFILAQLRVLCVKGVAATRHKHTPYSKTREALTPSGKHGGTQDPTRPGSKTGTHILDGSSAMFEAVGTLAYRSPHVINPPAAARWVPHDSAVRDPPRAKGLIVCINFWIGPPARVQGRGGGTNCWHPY